MINRIEKLFNITLQPKTVLGVVLTHNSAHLLNTFDTSMRTLTNSTRKRVGNKGWFKQWREYTNNRVMKYSVSNSRFMDMPLFWVSDVKTAVRSMLVRFVLKFPMQCKDVLFQVPLKLQDVLFLALVSTKTLPGNEQTFRGNYQIVKVTKRFHG